MEAEHALERAPQAREQGHYAEAARMLQGVAAHGVYLGGITMQSIRCLLRVPSRRADARLLAISVFAPMQIDDTIAIGPTSNSAFDETVSHDGPLAPPRVLVDLGQERRHSKKPVTRQASVPHGLLPQIEQVRFIGSAAHSGCPIRHTPRLGEHAEILPTESCFEQSVGSSSPSFGRSVSWGMSMARRHFYRKIRGSPKPSPAAWCRHLARWYLPSLETAGCSHE